MPEYTHLELAADRNASGFKQWQVAAACGVSDTTIKRWEAGRWMGERPECKMPDPDDIWIYLKTIGRPERWFDWMRSHYDSCRENLRPSVQTSGLHGSMARAKFELQDVLEKHDSVERDILDGTVDDPEQLAQYEKEVDEAISALSTVKTDIRTVKNDLR